MSEIYNRISQIESVYRAEKESKQGMINNLKAELESWGYTNLQIDSTKPWGASFKIDSDQTAEFVSKFFTDINPESISDAAGAGMTLLAPNARMSWHHHERRFKYLSFITAGAYNKGYSNDPEQISIAHQGDIVKIDPYEHHRLVGRPGGYTIVAEAWDHVDTNNPSGKDDIVRLSDDYGRG